jgi:hypothetical protein
MFLSPTVRRIIGQTGAGMFGTLASHVVAALGMALLVWLLFRQIDRASSDGLRREVARWLAPGTDPNGQSDWARNLSGLFDRLFGDALHSRRALLWSCVLSFASMSFLLGLFLLLDLGSVGMIRDMDVAAEGTLQTVLAGATFVAMMNFVPDYISLIVTRWIVRRIAGSPGTSARIGWLVLDGIATFFTLFAFMFLFTFLGWSLEGGISAALSGYPSFVDDFWWAIGPGSEHPVQLCFYSTFSTSLIVWLYLAAAFGLRDMAERAPRRAGLRWLTCGGRPIRALGAAAALVSFLATLAIGLLVSPGDRLLF